MIIVCDYGDVFIVVKGIIDLLEAVAANEDDKVCLNKVHLEITLHLGYAYKN